MSLIRFSFQNNHGNQSSVEPYYSPQSDELNSDDTIFRGSHRSCSLTKENTCVGVSFFAKKGLQLTEGRKTYSSLYAGKNEVDMIYCYVPIRNVYTKFGSEIFWPKENQV